MLISCTAGTPALLASVAMFADIAAAMREVCFPLLTGGLDEEVAMSLLGLKRLRAELQPA